MTLAGSWRVFAPAVLALCLGSPIAWAAGITWPDGQMLPTFAEPRQLDVVDVINSPGEVKLLMATLQGIVNRTEPRLYLLESPGGEGPYTWLRDLGVPYSLLNWRNAVVKYRDEVQGMIVYDPEVPDTINVATTLAGLRDAVVASPELAVALAQEPYGLQIVEDLRGRFRNKFEAYEWQYQHLWPDTTRRMLIGLSPGHTRTIGARPADAFTTVLVEQTQERTAANRKIYEIDLTPFIEGPAVYVRFEDNFPEDGWGPALHRLQLEADGDIIVDFIAYGPDEGEYMFEDGNSQANSNFDGHRYADNDRYFIYELPVPEGTEKLILYLDLWNQFKVSVSGKRPAPTTYIEPYGYLRDYAVANRAMVFWLRPNVTRERELFEKILADVAPGTPYLGWFADDIAGEFSGVELASSHGVYVLAADWFNNMTVFSGTRYKGAPDRPETTVRPLENKIYVTFIFGEGDNLQYNQHHMRVLWDDPNRGKVPINWTSSPLLIDAAPAILNYYHATATENDLLIAGPSGVGYFYGNVWPSDSFAEFLAAGAPYLERSGMPLVYALNRINEQNVRLTPQVARAYEEQYGLPGLFLSWESQYNTYLMNRTLPVSTVRGVGSVQEALTVLEEAKARWTGDRPLFIAVGLLAWNLRPTDALLIVNRLGPEFEVVLAEEYLALLRESFRLPPHVR